MNNISEEADCLIIGGGLGGLAAGALLARDGRRVLLLEAHSATGGCAGCFDRYDRPADGARRRFRFDVGATTVSGVGEGEPLRRLFDELGAWPELRRVDPGMICYLPDGSRLIRYSDPERWIAECGRVFGEQGQRGFWEEIFSTTRRAWRLSRLNPTFPPKSPGDLLRMARPANLASLPLLRSTWTPVLDVMRRHALESNGLFVRFIDEQLMITAQNRADDTPFLIGAMGLAYPADTWYPDGGMYSLAELLEREMKRNGGTIRTKRLVTALRREKGRWLAETSRGESYTAPVLISNATIYDMAELTSGIVQAPFRKLAREGAKGWGAFTLYCALSDTFDDRGTLYHQIHTERLPYCGGESIFVSLSHREDRRRAPEGWRTMTVSTHIAEPWLWEELAPDEYQRRKMELEERLFQAIGEALPGFARAERKFVLSGTPKTFGHYTHRMHGIVGGIPHSIRRNIFTTPKYRTPLEHLYLVGDTVYPGQGAPAVVLGALNLAEEVRGIFD